MTTHLPRIKARVSIHAHRKVHGLLDGEYLSTQTGRSMEFNDLREYVRGDDVKDIDWKATARTRQLLVKRFVATRQHTIMIVCSTGRSMAAQTTASVSKRELAVFVAGVIGWLATRHGDKVSILTGDRERQEVRPPSEREVALEQGLAAIDEAITPDAPESDIVGLLRFVARTVRKRTIMVVISDDHEVHPGLAAVLRRLAVQHEVMFVTVDDLDPTFDPGGRGAVDILSGEELPAWLHSDRRLHEEYAGYAARERHQMRDMLDGMGIAHERVLDDAGALAAVFHLLERHRHARR